MKKKLSKEEVAKQIQEDLPHTWIILKKMCEEAGCEIATIDFSSDIWYWTHSYTQSVEDGFLKWVTDYLYKNKDARLELTRFNSIYSSKKKCKDIANAFIFNYGFKVEEEE